MPIWHPLLIESYLGTLHLSRAINWCPPEMAALTGFTADGGFEPLPCQVDIVTTLRSALF